MSSITVQRFQFTQPKRAATFIPYKVVEGATFQFTQPKRAATLPMSVSYDKMAVSIHAAQAGCDLHRVDFAVALASFNSRSPSGLRLAIVAPSVVRALTFQFTQPKRAGDQRKDKDAPFQFTQPKRAATRDLSGERWRDACFNSRSPSGLRPPSIAVIISSERFQFTQPKRAATTVLYSSTHKQAVSIHAAQAGCDGCCKDTTKKRFSQRINRESPY